ncbi:hypothetical protein F66182_2294 [Fusarium sp. NRRL 66182]|nr:hypothetical protein F66182_2294 [Fusarium sp. NRRL 66182]
MASRAKNRPIRLLLVSFLILFALFVSLPAVDAQQTAPQDPCLPKINAVVPHPSNPPFGTMEQVHQVMKRCSTVKELNIHRTPPGCTDAGVRWNLPFALDGSDKYLSAPEILDLNGYDFDACEWDGIVPPRPHWSGEDGSWPIPSSSNPIIRWASDRYYRGRMYVDWAKDQWYSSRLFWWSFGGAEAWYRWRHVSVEQRSKTNIELWLDAMDFTKIHTLSIKRATIKSAALFDRLPKELGSLKSLTIDGTWDGTSSNVSSMERPNSLDFISAFPSGSLTGFSWVDSQSCDSNLVEAVVQHYGASLTRLAWTNSDVGHGHGPRAICTESELQTFGKFPKLTDLTIDLNRQDDAWPYGKLQAVARSVPHLTNLTILLNLEEYDTSNRSESSTDFYGSSRTETLAKPLLTADAARDMFNVLRKAAGSEKLETVTFKDIDWKGDPEARAVCTTLGDDGVRLGNGEPACEVSYGGYYKYYKDPGLSAQ